MSGERATKWLDTVYKAGVILGSLAMIWANATFAKKSDIDGIRDEIHALTTSVSITNEHVTQVNDHINQLIGVDRDHEMRLRLLENQRRN